MNIMIDIPQVAYKTWMFEYHIYDENGNRIPFMEREAEQDLEMLLRDYKYSADHDHT